MHLYVITVTFDSFNASLLFNLAHFFKKIPDPISVHVRKRISSRTFPATHSDLCVSALTAYCRLLQERLWKLQHHPCARAGCSTQFHALILGLNLSTVNQSNPYNCTTRRKNLCSYIMETFSYHLVIYCKYKNKL